LSAIDVAGFRDSSSHWRNIRDESRFIKVESDQPSYAPGQVREIVANRHAVPLWKVSILTGHHSRGKMLVVNS
jgi:hypothetical protein